MVVDAYNPSIPGAEAGGSYVQDQTSSEQQN